MDQLPFISFFLEVHQQLKTYRHRHPVEHVAKKEKVVKLLLHDVSANVLYKPDCDGVFACRSLLPLTHGRRAVVLQESFRLGWEGRSVFLKGIVNCFFLGHNDDATVEGHGTNMR